jgi:sugar phosphate isomerase/epimerase
MNIGCSTAFYKDDLEGALAKIAALKFQYIDLICIPGWNHIQPDDLVSRFDKVAEQTERLLDRHGLRVHAFNFAVPDLHKRADKAVNARRREQAQGLVRLMGRLGVKAAGFYPGYYAEGRAWDDILNDTVASLREMLEIAGEAGVVIGPEIHRFTPFETMAQARALLDAVPELTVVYDASHFVMQAIDLKETEFLIPRSHHVHFRGSAPDRIQCPLAESTANFSWMLERLKAHRYAGNASIEYLPDFPGDVENEIAELDTLLRAKN